MTSPVRTLHLAALAFCGLAAAAAQTPSPAKARVFDARFDTVWAAAAGAARDAFLVDRISRDDGRIRFRSGPLRAYRYEVNVAETGSGKTRVAIAVHSSYMEVERMARRNSDRYLMLVAERLQRKTEK